MGSLTPGALLVDRPTISRPASAGDRRTDPPSVGRGGGGHGVSSGSMLTSVAVPSSFMSPDGVGGAAAGLRESVEGGGAVGLVGTGSASSQHGSGGVVGGDSESQQLIRTFPGVLQVREGESRAEKGSMLLIMCVRKSQRAQRELRCATTAAACCAFCSSPTAAHSCHSCPIKVRLLGIHTCIHSSGALLNIQLLHSMIAPAVKSPHGTAVVGEVGLRRYSAGF